MELKLANNIPTFLALNLLIVLNGIETSVPRSFGLRWLSFNRTKWN